MKQPLKCIKNLDMSRKVSLSKTFIHLYAWKLQFILKWDVEIGHWEMDIVVGKKGTKTKTVLMVLSERVTRKELVFKIPSK